MSIIHLRKITLCGNRVRKRDTLDKLQALGCMHLVPLQVAPHDLEPALSERPDATYKALHYLLDAPRKRHPLRSDAGFDVISFVERVDACRRRQREVSDRRDFLAHRIEQLKPWGEFSFPAEAQLAGYKLWFYIVPLYQLRQIDTVELIWQEVFRDNRNVYIAVIAREEPQPDAMPVPRSRTGALSLSELQRQLEQVEIELDEIVAERERLTRWIPLLRRNLARAGDHAMLRHAAEQTLDDGSLFAIQGWVPERAMEVLRRFATNNELALLIETPGLEDNPPTLLENPERVAGGQDLLGFYQTPGYRTWDPSAIVFFSFALFFAMILSDAGYAATLGLVLAGFWNRAGRSATAQRLRLVAAWVVAMALLWGVLAGSYFGISPEPGTLLAGLKLFDINDFGTMMTLSISIGCAHLILANAMVAYQAPDAAHRAPYLGWIAVISGGFCLGIAGFSDQPRVLLQALGSLFLVVGFGLILWFSDHRPVASVRDAVLRISRGLLALTDISKAFGDVLSYMRLFALGLSSASLALTFNDLSSQLAQAMPGLGVLLSLLILIIGHGLNLVLGLMSGVVHGLRLNLIEFLNWGISEEGYPFKAFAKKEMEQ